LLDPLIVMREPHRARRNGSMRRPGNLRLRDRRASPRRLSALTRAAQRPFPHVIAWSKTRSRAA